MTAGDGIAARPARADVPPRWLAGFADAVRAVNRAFVALGMLLVAALMLMILQDVVLRYIVRVPTAWGVDFSHHVLTYLFFFGMGPALASGHHVAVDLFEAVVPRALRRFLPLLSSLLCLAFGAIMLWFLTRATLRAFSTGETTPTMIAIPVWWTYAAGPIGALQFVLNALLLVIRAARGEKLLEGARPAVDAAA
jgi:TRAP-type C4-dicarboxylate transport system permease small subunit